MIQMVASATVWLKNSVGCTVQPTTTAAVADARAQHKERKLRVTVSAKLNAQCASDTIISSLVESKTRTYHGRFGSARRTAGRRGAARPGKTGRRRVGWPRCQPSLYVALQGIVDNCPERPFASANKGNPM